LECNVPKSINNMYWPVYRRSVNWKTYIKQQDEIAKAIHANSDWNRKTHERFFLNVCCVFEFYIFLCCSVCWFLYGPFCQGALKLKISTLFTTFFPWTSHKFKLWYICWFGKSVQRLQLLQRFWQACTLCEKNGYFSLH